ncbi:tetratricopeptide-like helical [Podospora aff. communis PSN243]|uniref:Tetratricopeptide-like helical n=1 Tax=Podospora aff. communis PSN243 TaxID=3040156 RepID=A0AAV9H4B3_9PEZI|nr:tetratricopeptide-like helical [Podospora aff. communis PSN243]
MDRRGFDSPMDWDYENRPPVDHSSPFATTSSRTQRGFFSPSKASASPFESPSRSLPSPPRSFFNPSLPQKPSPPNFRNPAFTTPQKRVEELAYCEYSGPESSPSKSLSGDLEADPAAATEPESEDHPTDRSVDLLPLAKAQRNRNHDSSRRGGGGVTTAGVIGTVKIMRSASREKDRQRTRSRRKLPSLIPGGADSDSNVSISEGDGPQRPRFRIGRQDHDPGDEQESSARYIASGTLVSLFIGGNFYYKVVSVSASMLWAYAALVFPRKANHKQKAKSDRRLGDRVLGFLAIVARVSGFLVLLVWCVLLTPIQIFVPTPMDAWTRYAEHPPFRSYEVLRQPEHPIVDVFAIHGLGSNPRSAWRYVGNGTEVYWLQDLLPQQEGFENLRIIMINHQTRWDSNSPEADFDVFAKMMLDEIEHLHHKNRPIIFIAHSFGGLLLKRSLVLATSRSKDVARMTKGVLFLGVPHFGTKAAFIASLLACTAYWRGSSTTMLEYMAEGNSIVERLDKDFDEAYAEADSKREYDTPYISNFLEMRPERFGKLSLSPTVNTKSGSLRYGKEVRLDTDHRGLNKFRATDDPNFELFLRQFRRALLHAGYGGDSPKASTGRRWLGT